MNRNGGLRVGVLTLALATAGLLMPAPGSSQTQGMERRQTRRERRDDARETRQKGRHEARDTKRACRDAGGNPIECQHEKRTTKHEARQKSRDVRMGTNPSPGAPPPTQ